MFLYLFFSQPAALGDIQLLALNLYFTLKINNTGISTFSIITIFLFSAKLTFRFILLSVQLSQRQVIKIRLDFMLYMSFYFFIMFVFFSFFVVQPLLCSLQSCAEQRGRRSREHEFFGFS